MRKVACLVPILMTLVGCSGDRDVTPEAIRAARATWHKARIEDYNLEWTSSGLRNNHYRVAVRGGEVKRIDTILPGGKEVEAHPARPSFYGVDGLFVTIEDELAQLGADAPFGQPKGTRAILKFDPDPTLGYPRRYRRDVMGSRQGIAIDVIGLERTAPGAPPPPSGARIR